MFSIFADCLISMFDLSDLNENVFGNTLSVSKEVLEMVRRILVFTDNFERRTFVAIEEKAKKKADRVEAILL